MRESTSKRAIKLVKQFYQSELLLRQNMQSSLAQLKRDELLRAYSFFEKCDQKISKSQSLFPFQNLLSDLSFTFTKIMSLGEQLGIPFEVRFRTPRRLVAEWEPFSGKTYINPIQSELAWLIDQSVTDMVREEFKALLQFNTNQIHDRAHNVFFMLMPPALGEKDLNNYFVFIEALVCVSEIFVSLELGPELAEYFVSFHSLSRSLKEDQEYLAKVKNREELFKTALANLLTRFHGWSLSQRKMLPNYCSYVKTSALDTPEYVVQQMFPAWAKENRGNKYPRKFRNSKVRQRRIQLKSFAVEDLLKEDQLDLIWKWYKQLFLAARLR